MGFKHEFCAEVLYAEFAALFEGIILTSTRSQAIILRDPINFNFRKKLSKIIAFLCRAVGRKVNLFTGLQIVDTIKKLPRIIPDIYNEIRGKQPILHAEKQKQL